MSGGGGGSILAMITSYRDNMKMLRKSAFNKKDREKIIYDKSGRKKKIELQYKELSPEKLLHFKQELKERRKRIRIRNLLISLLSLFIVVFLVVKLGIAINNPGTDKLTFELMDIKRELTYRELRYEAYVSEGDNWQEANNWDYAIKYYSNAIDVFPEKYEARAGLYRTYIYRYFETGILKDYELSFIDNTITRFPDKAELYFLRAKYYSLEGYPEKAATDRWVAGKLSNPE